MEKYLYYQVGEAWLGTYNSETEYRNAAVVQDATGLSIYRSLKSGNVGHPLTDQEWWFCIIDLSGIKSESDRIAALNEAIATDETLRVAAETARENNETSRQNAETRRVENESDRQTAETQRVTDENQRRGNETNRQLAEQQRAVNEQGRTDAETLRVNAENDRQSAETQRQLNETGRVNAETARVAQYASDHGTAAADHTQAESDHTRAGEDHTRADGDHTQAGNDHTRAGEDHTQAGTDHTTAGNDHTRAGEDHTQAGTDHTTAGNDHTRAGEDHTASVAATEAANQAAAGANALQQNLENGTVVPALTGNLESWEEDGGQDVTNQWDETIRTTAGDDPIDSDEGGTLDKIVAKTDFKCSGLLATAYNQLRLKSNGGGAVAVGAGWYFPVPKLVLGAFGSAEENNGLLLTDNDGNNITNATVYFKPLASGVPTSVTDGTVCASQNVTYGDKTYKVYTTSGPGYLIISDITYANTCAHIAWEDWYDKFVSPTAEDDLGDSIDLTGLFSAAPNGTGKFLVCGSVATYAERISATQIKITDPIGRETSPSWTNTLQEDGVTYLHTLVISGMKEGGEAMIEGSDQALTVEGTTVSYSDTESTAISGAVRYEKSAATTATVTLAKTAYTLNDCGIEMKEGAEGSAWFTNTYTQNIPDALSQIAKVKMTDVLNDIAANTEEIEKLSGLVTDPVTDADFYELPKLMGQPMKLFGNGTPQASVVPDNWIQLADGGFDWNGVPSAIGQEYINTAVDTGGHYIAVRTDNMSLKWVNC